MQFELVPLSNTRMQQLGISPELRKAYLFPGSVAYCLLADGNVVVAGGIVNMDWHRGEAWVIVSNLFTAYKKTCLSYLRKQLPLLASDYGFKRIQATCLAGTSCVLVEHLGFAYEGLMRGFGPNNENCMMYSRLF